MDFRVLSHATCIAACIPHTPRPPSAGASLTGSGHPASNRSSCVPLRQNPVFFLQQPMRPHKSFSLWLLKNRRKRRPCWPPMKWRSRCICMEERVARVHLGLNSEFLTTSRKTTNTPAEEDSESFICNWKILIIEACNAKNVVSQIAKAKFMLMRRWSIVMCSMLWPINANASVKVRRIP